MIELSRPNISVSRAVAFRVLQAVSEGAYASDTLLDLSSGLDRRDAGLASQIVFGCLRFQAQLDFLIELYSGHESKTFDTAVNLVLRIGMFQLRYLDRIPAHAAVRESVELIKPQKRSAAGLVNAVLRKVNRSPVRWPTAAIELSCPAWLLDRWTKHFGSGEARAIAQAALREPVPYVRIAPGTAAPAPIRLEDTGLEGCFRVSSDLPVGVRLHDFGAQSIVPLLDLQPGQTFLDLCAAPGNKTLQALETSLDLAVACDVSPRRAAMIPPVCARVVLDASRALPFSRRFDRILIDAPCSGTGTLGRNPEIKWRVQQEDFYRFREKQSSIVLEGLRRLAPGGKLVYSTCSLEAEENEEVTRRALSGVPGLKCDKELWRLPGRDEGDGFYAARFVLASQGTG